MRSVYKPNLVFLFYADGLPRVITVRSLLFRRRRPTFVQNYPKGSASQKQRGDSSETNQTTLQDASAKDESFNQLRGLISGMKIKQTNHLVQKMARFGNSDLFNYATRDDFSQDQLKQNTSDTWSRFDTYDIENSLLCTPLTGFDELIKLTEEKRLWKYPIDNEQGLEAEQAVPFEDHVFLDQYLGEFPKNEYIQQFMGYILAGLSKNSWMTVERKMEIVKFYKDYFEEKLPIYRERGLEV